MKVMRLIVLAVLACLSAQAARASELAAFIKSNYTKYEYEIPMRDGKALFTAVYVPKDTARSYAIMLTRTPYSVAPYGVDQFRDSLGPSEIFTREKFIFAYQDVRGRFMSQGEFVEMTPHVPVKTGPEAIDESTDTYDTIDWLVKNIPNNNGNVGLWGISYPGFYTAAGMIDAHPALKAASPQAPVADLYMGDDCYHNGAFFLAANFGFFTDFFERKEPTRPVDQVRFDYGTPSGYEFYLAMGPLVEADEKYFHSENPYWTDLVAHPNYDEFWKQRNIVPHLKNVPPAVMTVGGWYDAEDLAGTLRVFQSIGEKNPATSNHLVMGPWVHGGWAWGDGDRLGEVRFDSKTSEFYRQQIEFPFFNDQLNGKGGPDLPTAWVFETGTNQWRQFDAWPPRNVTVEKLYFHPNGKLSFEPPDETAEDSTPDEYVSDPNKPVPYVGYTTMGMAQEYMVSDQRFAASRTDVLVFESDPLTEDITVVGPVSPVLYVSTTGTDSDFVIKLIDVYPADYPDNVPNPADVRMGGYQRLVRGEPFRAKFRNSFEQPEPMVPGEIARIEFAMPDICHVFRKGHKIMVQVQSSWFPLVDRNPQTFVDIPHAKPEDFRKATQRVNHSQEAASALAVYVLGRQP
jgi:putative CocE/NonD family hydrolase